MKNDDKQIDELKMHDYFNKSNFIIKKIDEEFLNIWKLGIDIHRKKFEVGKEYQVEDDISKSIERFKYYSNRWLYHANLFIEAINKEIERVVNIPNSSGNYASIPPSNQNAAYEFDAFLSSIGIIFENNIKEDFLQKISSKNNKSNLEKLWDINRKADGLFWRINVLRNRVVHSDSEAFTEQGLKFMEFSSEIQYIEKTNLSDIKFISHLIDIKNNDNLYKIINSEIIEESKKIKCAFKKEKKDGNHSNCIPVKPDFFSVIFRNGNKTRNPYMVISSDPVDLIKTFNSIMEDLSTFYRDILNIIKNDLIEKL
ncbi:hypothetical protein ACN9JY_03200 [Aliarcobacter butzleri]|uniref:hypothetical protein n=1 Tax=Aliarcobacter butzleri TaxID=28197 RepID=UPI003B21574B